MVTSKTHNIILKDYQSSIFALRYYGSYAKRYRVYCTVIRIVYLLPLLSATNISLNLFDNWVNVALGFVIAVAVVFDLTFNFSAKAVVLQNIFVECMKLSDQWDILMNKIVTNSISEENAIDENFKFLNKATSIVDKASSAGIYTNNKLALKCERIAKHLAMEKYQYVEESRETNIT